MSCAWRSVKPIGPLSLAAVNLVSSTLGQLERNVFKLLTNVVDAPKEIWIRILELIRYVQAAYSFPDAFWPVIDGQ